MQVLAEGAAATVTRIDLPTWAVWMLGIVLGIYMLVLFGVSMLATGNVENEEDFLVAGRRLSLFLSWGSLIATWFGAASMNGASTAARKDGLLGVVLDPFACSATLILAGMYFAAPMWRLKLLTTGDFFRRAYGSGAELIGCCIQVPAYFGWIAAQYIALGNVQEAYFGIPKHWGILIGCLITVVYTMVGGMWSVTLTDTIQIVIAFAGLLALAYSVFSQFGGGSAFAGVDHIAGQLGETSPEVFSILPAATAVATLGWVGTWATGLFGNIPGQDLQQRIFSAKDEKTASWACIWSGIFYFAFGMIPVAIGLAARITDPESDPDKILQLMAGKYLNPYLAVVFVVSFVSIVMSTSCSAVLAPATILGHNLLGRFAMFRGRGLVVERACVFFISMCGLAMAYWGESIMSLLDLALSMALVALFVPLVMGLYGRPRSPWCAYLAMCLGTAAYFTRYLPEKVFLADAVELANVDFAAYVGATYGVVWQDLATIPADLYGFGMSFLGYGIGQVLFFRRAPINDAVRMQAFDLPADKLG